MHYTGMAAADFALGSVSAAVLLAVGRGNNARVGTFANPGGSI